MDWIKFNWGENDIWGYKNNDVFTIDLSNIEKTDLSPLEESINLIKKIVQEYPPPYNLFLSGGIDSQAMLYAWLKSKEKFNIISFTYNKNYNSHDLFTLNIVAKKFNVKVNYYDIDYFYFLNNELYDYSKNYVCNSPQITFYIKLSESINEGTNIFSGHPLNLTNAQPSLDYTILGLYRYKLKTKKSIIPFFFCSDAKLAYSFHKTYIQNTIPFISRYNIKNYDVKSLHYLQSGFDIIPTNKYSGFEKYKKFYDSQNDLIHPSERLKYHKFISKRNFDIIFRYRLFELNNYSTTIKCINPNFDK